ncbi:MAG: hypothetical protein WAV00_17395 [Nocardioides sp.]
MNRTQTQNRAKAKRAAAVLAAAPLALTLLTMSPATAADRPPVSAAAAMWADEPDESRVDKTEVDAAVERLRAAGMWADETPGSYAENAASTGLAKDFGGRLLSEAFTYGSTWALDEVLTRLGLNADADLAAALGKVGLSITALQADVTRMMEMMHQVLHGQDKSNFYSSYTGAGLAASRIDTAMRSVADWVKHDLQPSEKNVSDMALVVNVAMGELAFITTNPVTGTIPLMMKAAEASNVTDFNWSFYEKIDEVRDSYRATYAQGLATMDMLLAWDRDGTVSTTRARLVSDAVAATKRAYEHGIELNVATPTKGPVVQVRNGDRLISAWTPDAVNGNGWNFTNTQYRQHLEPILRSMAENYNPAQHGGVSLQKYLEDRKIPTSFVYYDSFHNYKKTGGGTLTRYISYELRANTGEIRGNDYHVGTLSITKNERAVRQDWTPWGGWSTDKNSQKEGDAWYAAVEAGWKQRARTMDRYWTDTYKASSWLFVKEVQNNAAGWAADFDTKRVEKAAFPGR